MIKLMIVYDTLLNYYSSYANAFVRDSKCCKRNCVLLENKIAGHGLHQTNKVLAMMLSDQLPNIT